MDKEKEEYEQAERLTVFIESMASVNTPFLQELEKKALEEQVPIIRTQTQGLIKFLLEVIAPRRILEIGTAVGFSALLMHTYAPEGCRITTIEKMDERADQALDNFHKAGVREGEISLLRGDAGEILGSLQEDESYDFIFLDGPKGQYINYLPELKRLLRPGGVLLSDNILKEGEILESKFAVTRRNRTIHKRMRAFLTALTQDPELRTVILDTGDGAALSVKSRR